TGRRDRRYGDRPGSDRNLADAPGRVSASPPAGQHDRLVGQLFASLVVVRAAWIGLVHSPLQRVRVGDADHVPPAHLWITACLAAALALATKAPAQQPDEEVANLTFKIADALYERGNVLLRKKAFDRAISDYTEAIAFYPQPFAGAYVGRGSAYEEKKDYFK